MATLIRRKWTWSSISAAISFVEASLILAKIGIENVPSNLATSIRTVIVLLMAWTIVLGKRKAPFVKQVPKKDLLFLVLSGFATAGSWLCYYDAIAQGQVSVVVPIDKLSVLLTVLFSVLVLKEKAPVEVLARAWPFGRRDRVHGRFRLRVSKIVHLA